MNDSWPSRILYWFRSDPRRGDMAVAGITALVATVLVFGRTDDIEPGRAEVLWLGGVFLVTVFRRRSPLLLLAVTLTTLVAYVLISERPTPLIFAVLVLLTTACIRLDRQRAIIVGIVVGSTLYVLNLLVADEAAYADARAVIAIAWTAGAVGIADAIRSWRHYKISAEAEARSAVLAAEAQARQQVSEERLEIARELHDLLAHNLSVMNVQAGAALHLLRSDPDTAEQSLIAARNAGRSVLDELREVLTVLRRDEDGHETATELTASLPTVGEIDRLVDTMRTSGLNIDWTTTGAPRPLPSATSLAAYRVAQEMLTNAAKHGVGPVGLSTEWTDAGLTIRASNEFGGTAAIGSGLGLTGMRERAAANGGRFSAGPSAGRFNVEVWLPAVTTREIKQ